MNEPLEISRVYRGLITKVVDFGCFVQLPCKPAREGLLHISNFSHSKIQKSHDFVQV